MTYQPPKMRSLIEIQRYHDILSEILTNPEIQKRINWSNDSAHARSNMLAIKRTLCWILQHDSGKWLEDNMKTVEKTLEDLGFELKSIQ